MRKVKEHTIHANSRICVLTLYTFEYECMVYIYEYMHASIRVRMVAC